MRFNHIRQILFLCSLLYFNLYSLAIGEILLEDDSYTVLRLEKQVNRVISLSPNITELIFAAGAGDKLIGVVEGSDYPPAALSVKTVGSYNHINLEQIVALKADLIIAWHKGTKQNIIDNLKKIGLKVFLLNPTKIRHIPKALKKIGEIFGTQDQAQKAVDEFESKLAGIKTNKLIPASKVFVQIWDKPLISLNGKDIYSDIIEHCGGINIFAKSSFIAPIINPEYVLIANPDIILLSSKEKNNNLWEKYWRQWPSLKAVKNNKIYIINPDLTNRATPRIIDGIKNVCNALDNA